eukprot:CAMPEP_0185760462 /NCGR_PEP_ID=MMETSP1174-20130828/19324_1 /TAXON_ID=35687 /ORGANISM="Dictyocha speculum, Strain CCMP1381" /LENGTH=229 /DNA_ID=CAMNT_0028441285 /DNA_START=24 /DNA_END=713 /DNA_ORIENTATION=+
MISSYKNQIGACLLKAAREDRLSSAAIVAYVDAGADLNVRDGNGNTPLLILIQRRQPRLASELVEQGARVSGMNDASETAGLLCEKALDELKGDESETTTSSHDFRMLMRLIDDIHEPELRRDKEEEEERQRRRVASRQRQQSLDRQHQNRAATQQQDALNEAMTANGIGPGVGFFPSLFGLQFQSEVPSPLTSPPTGIGANEQRALKVMDVAFKVVCGLLVVLLVLVG